MTRASRPLTLNDNDILSQGYNYAGLSFRTTSFSKVVGDPETYSLMISVWADRGYHKYTVVEQHWPKQGVVIDRGVLRHEEDLRALDELVEDRHSIPF